jgi:hypothetical protein
MFKRALILTAGLLTSGFAAAGFTNVGNVYTIDCVGTTDLLIVPLAYGTVATVNFGPACTAIVNSSQSGAGATCDFTIPGGSCQTSATAANPVISYFVGRNSSGAPAIPTFGQGIQFYHGSAIQSQTITFGTAPTIVAGATGTVSATATSNLTVTFSSTTPAICTVAGSTVTGVSAGTCVIAADQAGNSSYSAAPQVTQNITISPAPAAASIPTLSEWGMIILSSLLALGTLVIMRRRQG